MLTCLRAHSALARTAHRRCFGASHAATDEIVSEAWRTASGARCRYYALRHGESEANVAGVISSLPAVATKQHGLSAEGRRQAEASGDAFAAALRREHAAAAAAASAAGAPPPPPRRVAIFASDFRRTAETAEAVLEALLRNDCGDDRGGGGGGDGGGGAAAEVWRGGVQLREALRERSFGELHGASVDRYGEVWAEDALDAAHEVFGVESVRSVLRRSAALVAGIEHELLGGSGDGGDGGEGGWTVLLVAHGDVLQIAQTAFARVDPTRHRELPHLETAAVRELIVAGS